MGKITHGKYHLTVRLKTELLYNQLKMLLYIKELIFKKISYDRLIDFLNCCIYLFLITSWIGFTGGSNNNHRGAAVEPLCLPRNPEWGIYTNGHDGYRNYIHGAEYETGSFRGYMKTVHNHDVPCAVCLVHQRSVIKMFPG